MYLRLLEIIDITVYNTISILETIDKYLDKKIRDIYKERHRLDNPKDSD